MDFTQRMKSAETVLRDTSDALSRRGSSLPDELRTYLQGIVSYHTQFPGWLEAHRIRERGMALLQNIDQQTNNNHQLTFEGLVMEFSDARMLLTQGYLAATWSLADRISALLTQLYALDEVTKNPIEQTRLMANFFSRKRSVSGENKKELAKIGGLTAFVLKSSYGWPMAVSYVARNLFLHEGGVSRGQPFFEGNRATDGFKMSDDAISELQTRAQNYGDCPATWSWKQDDFRALMIHCHGMLDRAISQLVLAGCENVRTQLRLLLE